MRYCFLVILFFVLSGCKADIYPDMVFVEGGCVQLGNNNGDGDADENPYVEIEIESFYIGKYEVTQREWKLLMGGNPSYFQGDDKPVECVSWYDAQVFIQRLNEITGEKFRLPTEEEWIYAAKGGKFQEEYLYSGSDLLCVIANADFSLHSTDKVGTKQPNSLGIYDMTGNVHEWCGNDYDSLLYLKYAKVLPFDGVGETSEKTFKGGSWASGYKYSRIENRNHVLPETRNFDLGFRVVLECE